MGLLQVFTNPGFQRQAASLVRRLGKLKGRPADARHRPEPRRARYGSVERAVLSAVLAFDRPVTIRQVLDEVERELGTTFRPGSIKSCLAKLASDSEAPVKRLGRGVYQASEERSSAS